MPEGLNVLWKSEQFFFFKFIRYCAANESWRCLRSRSECAESPLWSPFHLSEFCGSPRDSMFSRCRSRNTLSLSFSPHVTCHSISTPKRSMYTKILERTNTSTHLERDTLASANTWFRIMQWSFSFWHSDLPPHPQLPNLFPLPDFSLSFPFLMPSSFLPWMSKILFRLFGRAVQHSAALNCKCTHPNLPAHQAGDFYLIGSAVCRKEVSS